MLDGRMKNTPADTAVADKVLSVSAEELRQFIERAEFLAEAKRNMTGHERELFAEAKGRGYDTKAIRKIIAIRRRRPDEVAEEQAVMDLYLSALGMC
jgi:uncharacterized protein (UPF0335 family)